MKSKTYRVLEPTLSVVKILLALFMMLAGGITAFGPLHPMDGSLGFIYQSHLWLFCFGLIFFLSGLTLFVGKVARNKKLTGHGLMAIFCCFIFGAILNGIAGGGAVSYWLPNTIAAVGTGMLWLWWKFKTEYINVSDFRKETVKIQRRHKI